MELNFVRSIQSDDITPKYWYNIVPDLPEQLPPMIKPDGSVVEQRI